jgi:hypothetical protein
LTTALATTDGVEQDGAVDERTITPVKWWAAAGACFLALEIYLFASWIGSGDATATPSGPDRAPAWMRTVVHTWQALGVVAALGVVYVFLVRQRRRERRLTLDGMFVVVFGLLYWQDPLVNYSQNWATFNSELINFGSWGPQLPGWIAPQSNLFAEPIVWALPSYLYAVFGIVVLANFVMRKAKSRWPRLGTAGLVGICLGFTFTTDLLAEIIFIRFGIYAYPGGISGITLWHGHYYQLPLNEVALMSLVFTGWASLRYFRNDKGQTFAERGADQLQLSPRRRSAVRFLALLGAANVVMLGLFMIPMQWFALHAGAWPQDIVDRSYLSNNMCGPRTTYACPGPDVPINRPGSDHVDPAGEVVEE